jgi:hypothetical protein
MHVGAHLNPDTPGGIAAAVKTFVDNLNTELEDIFEQIRKRRRRKLWGMAGTAVVLCLLCAASVVTGIHAHGVDRIFNWSIAVAWFVAYMGQFALWNKARKS